MLIGKIVFHATRGADMTSALPGLRRSVIGGRAGLVTRVNGPNRIYYESPAGDKYLSLAGIGFVCDTDEEARSLEALRDATTNEARSALFEIYARLERNLETLPGFDN